MNKHLLTTLSVMAAGCCAGLALPAQAATVSKNIYQDPSLSCQLSIPTTDTAIRPRATGYRNEGGVTSFVICGIPYVYGGALDSTPTTYRIVALSFDGNAHTFSCTGVSRFSSGGSPQYSVKSVEVLATGAATTTTWTDADLEMENFDASITCALPDGAAITSVSVEYNDEIGS